MTSHRIKAGCSRRAGSPDIVPVRKFLRVLGPTQLGFAYYTGNRQMLSTGNLAAIDRVALFLMDYARRERLKILGHARVLDARQSPELVARLELSQIHHAALQGRGGGTGHRTIAKED